MPRRPKRTVTLVGSRAPSASPTKRTSAPSGEGVGPPVLACCAELAPHAIRVPKVRATKAAAIGRSDLSPMRLHADISPFSSCWAARAVGDYLPFNSRPCRSVSQPQLGHVQPPHSACFKEAGLRYCGSSAAQRGQVLRPAPAIIMAAMTPPIAPPATGNPARSASAATAAMDANLIMTSPCPNEIELLLLVSLRARLDGSISNGQDMSRGLHEADIRG